MVLDLYDPGGQWHFRPGLDQHEQFPAVDGHLDLTHLAPLVHDLARARHLPAALIARCRLEVRALQNTRHLPDKYPGLGEVLDDAVQEGFHGRQAQLHDVVGQRVWAKRTRWLGALPLLVTPLTDALPDLYGIEPCRRIAASSLNSRSGRAFMASIPKRVFML